tara:strand:+ start:87 stop:1025 length:939 start_codon:yes stop_codon:yes gene_type:complete
MKKESVNIHISPIAHFSEAQTIEYCSRAIKIDDKSLNKNTCNSQREVKNPYVSYKSVKPTSEWGNSAEIRVLRFYNSPKSLKALSRKNVSRVLVAVKSENTYGNWEFGDMYFWQIAEYLANNDIEEIQRDVEYGLYEFRMSIFHYAMAEEKSEDKVMLMLQQDTEKLLKDITSGEINFEEFKHNLNKTRDMIINEARGGNSPFRYRTSNSLINENLSFLSDSFNHMEDFEVEIITTFLEHAIVNIKGEQLKRILAGEKRKITPSELKSLVDETGIFDIIEGFKHELSNMEKQFKQEYVKAGGMINGNEVAKA